MNGAVHDAMRRLGRGVGLRARIALAMTAVALAAVALAAALTGDGLDNRLDDFARERLSTATEHVSRLALDTYREDGDWTRRAVREVEHLAAANDLRVALRDADGQLLTQPLSAGARATLTLRRGTRRVGVIEAAPATGAVSPDDRSLRSSLDRLHLVAALGAAGLALALAVLLAGRLTAPLTALRRGADSLGKGSLDTRIEPAGPPEFRSVATALNRLAEALEQEEAVRRQTTADVAHELRTPLQGLLGRIEAAQDRVMTNGKDGLDVMHSDAVRLTELVRDLETLADADRPDLLLAREPVDLAAVAGAEAGALADRFGRAGIALEVHASPAPVLGDARRLGQVVRNLLTNALRFTDAGGTVEVSAGTEGEGAFVRVRDTGIGIEPAELRNVFKRFWRGDRSRSRTRGGAGIGLAIVERLVTAHGGSISVQSEPGRGSAFEVRLPAEDRARASSP
jgi:two-component system sensor histidine kinase BaeS